VKLAALGEQSHTSKMAAPSKHNSLILAAIPLILAVAAIPSRADEIRLKDGKKLNGVIVGYEDNMFKVKTDFGYVLVEKDKIASIIPSTPAAPKDAKPAAKKDPASPAKSPEGEQPSVEPAVALPADAGAEPTNASVKSVVPGESAKKEKAASKITNVAAKPDLPASSSPVNATPPAIKSGAATPANNLTANAAPPAPPKEPELPANREEVQGNLYTNYTHGFRMYKAPSWNLIEDARSALPNAIVAMGTYNESTLLVVGQEKTKDPLAAAATTVEKRLRDVYSNYRQTSERKTVVGGMPAIEYRYRGMADDHDWSGTLVVLSHGNDIFTVLGMTYADNDLIQIQENVIARSIASLDFSAH
jgi:hypothetical protein